MHYKFQRCPTRRGVIQSRLFILTNLSMRYTSRVGFFKRLCCWIMVLTVQFIEFRHISGSADRQLHRDIGYEIAVTTGVRMFYSNDMLTTARCDMVTSNYPLAGLECLYYSRHWILYFISSGLENSGTCCHVLSALWSRSNTFDTTHHYTHGRREPQVRPLSPFFTRGTKAKQSVNMTDIGTAREACKNRTANDYDKSGSNYAFRIHNDSARDLLAVVIWCHWTSCRYETKYKWLCCQTVRRCCHTFEIYLRSLLFRILYGFSAMDESIYLTVLQFNICRLTCLQSLRWAL